MKLFGMEKLSLVDFDGYVATTVFTGSCNFRCGFCHNGPLVINVNNLETISEDEVVSYILKRKGIIEGVCISGGEPTLNPDLPQFAEKIKNLGVKVKVDTNGTNPDMIKSLVENGVVDYFAMDIKNNKEDYAKIIGFDNYDTLSVEKSVEFFLTNKIDFEFRTTLIKEFHKAENIEKIGQWICGTKKYFMQKYKEVDTCLTHNYSEVSNDDALVFLDTIKKYVPNAKLRGYDIK